MKKIFASITAICTFFVANAQTNTSKQNVISKAGDHIMLQLGSNQWTGSPDSIASHKTGLSRAANVYVMMNKPFKTNNHYSVAIGVGVSTSSQFFKNINIDVKSTATRLPFTDVAAANHFKKYKLVTAYLELPIELRFTADPENDAKSIKGAVGVKVGQLLNVHTKGKTLLNAAGSAIGSYTEKENSKRYFNTTRLSLTARVGYGHFSLYGSYGFSSMLKDGAGPTIKPYQVGITISGL